MLNFYETLVTAVILPQTPGGCAIFLPLIRRYRRNISDKTSARVAFKMKQVFVPFTFVLMNFTKKSVVFRPISYFRLTLSLHSRNVKKWKSHNNQFPISSVKMKIFSATCIFWTKLWTANNEHSNCFGTEAILKGSQLTSKVAKGYFCQVVWYWLMGNVPRFKKIHSNTHTKRFTKIICGPW